MATININGVLYEQNPDGTMTPTNVTMNSGSTDASGVTNTSGYGARRSGAELEAWQREMAALIAAQPQHQYTPMTPQQLYYSRNPRQAQLDAAYANRGPITMPAEDPAARAAAEARINANVAAYYQANPQEAQGQLGAIGGVQNDPRYAPAPSAPGASAPSEPTLPGPTGGSWMTGNPSEPPRWVPDGTAIAMGGGLSPAAPGGAAPNPFGAVSPRPLADYYDASDPFSGFRVEPLDPNYSQTTAAQVTPGGIAELMNPYLQSVRDQTMTDIERQRQLAQMTTDDQANSAKAFGGNRHGVANALTNDAFARQSAQQYANLNAQGYNAAANLATQNAGLAQQAGLSNAANYMTGRGQDISQNQAFMNNALAQRGQDIGQNQFNANLGLQQRGQDIGWNLGQMGQQLNAYNVAGNLLNASGNMDWNSLNQANSATSQPGSSTTTTPGADPWNTLIGGLITGWGLTRP